MTQWGPRFAATLALALLVTACSVLSPQADRTKYFVLKPLAVPERQPVGGFDRSVGLGPVSIPDHLDHQIVTRLADNELAVSDTDRWGEPLREGFTRTLRQNLVALLGTERVVIYPWDPAAAPDLAITIEVLQFERTTKGTAELAVRWTIELGSDRTPLMTQETHLSRAIEGEETRAAVAALNAGLVALSEQIAAAVRRVPLEKAGAAIEHR
jgi:uncharacterized lipoprotein YmbA